MTRTDDALRVRSENDDLPEARGVAGHTNKKLRIVQDQRSGDDISLQFPPEILAIVFGFLVFRGRIAVSHVCHRWRSIALAHPSIWANIFLSDFYRDGASLVCMALSRSGKHPVRLAFLSDCDRKPELLSHLATHMDHIRQLDWCLGCHALPLTLPAPLLSEIRGGDLRITSDFLGGQAGSLTEVFITELYLPASCPALSTVTTLDIFAPESVEAATNYDQLFVLCPCLQSLHISNLRVDLAGMLPAGPAPQSLQELYLQCSDDSEYDLMRHYMSWKTSGNLSHVTLAQECTDINLTAFIGGAVELAIVKQYRVCRTEVIASGADDWQRAISFLDVNEDHPAYVARLIAGVVAHLPNLHTLEIDASYLDAFLPTLASWPKLTQLVLEVSPLEEDDSYEWTQLRGLSHIGEHSGSLASVVVSVAACSDPPGRYDAHKMLRHLALCSIPDVLVRGFAQATVDAVESQRTLNGGRIRFEFTRD